MMKRLERYKRKDRMRRNREKRKGSERARKRDEKRKEREEERCRGGLEWEVCYAPERRGTGTHHTGPLGSTPICTTQMAQG